MTPKLARNQIENVTDADYWIRRLRSLPPPLEGFCSTEFASWTIYTVDFGHDDFLGECMALHAEWTSMFCLDSVLPCGCTLAQVIESDGDGWLRRTELRDEEGIVRCETLVRHDEMLEFDDEANYCCERALPSMKEVVPSPTVISTTVLPPSYRMVPSSPSTVSLPDGSEASSSSSSLSTIYPSSAHPSSSFSSSPSSSSSSICYNSEASLACTNSDLEYTEDESEHCHHASSPSSSGYDSEPVVLKKMATTVSTPTEAPGQSSAADKLAEFDEMLERLVQMKKAELQADNERRRLR